MDKRSDGFREGRERHNGHWTVQGWVLGIKGKYEGKKVWTLIGWVRDARMKMVSYPLYDTVSPSWRLSEGGDDHARAGTEHPPPGIDF